MPWSEIGLQTEEPFPTFIGLYKQMLAFKTSEVTKVGKMSMCFKISIKKTEVSLQADQTMQLSRIDRRDVHLLFESPQIILIRRKKMEDGRTSDCSEAGRGRWGRGRGCFGTSFCSSQERRRKEVGSCPVQPQQNTSEFRKRKFF